MKGKNWIRSTISIIGSITLSLLIMASAGGPGFEQSPIDFQSEMMVKVDNDHLPDLKFRYGSRVSLDVVNTGSPEEEATIRSNVPPGSGQLRAGGVAYDLLQFHWHTPSEHLVEGEEFPMEMHLVHQADDGALLVLGVFIERGDRHREIDKIFADLPEDGSESTVVPRFNLRKLLPQRRESFRYMGSLTTPPFTEGVTWIVLAEPIEMSTDQIESFRRLFPHDNTREVQPLNGRTVVTDVALGDDDGDGDDGDDDD